jgi:hypothetical protein
MSGGTANLLPKSTSFHTNLVRAPGPTAHPYMGTSCIQVQMIPCSLLVRQAKWSLLDCTDPLIPVVALTGQYIRGCRIRPPTSGEATNTDSKVAHTYYIVPAMRTVSRLLPRQLRNSFKKCTAPTTPPEMQLVTTLDKLSGADTMLGRLKPIDWLTCSRPRSCQGAKRLVQDLAFSLLGRAPSRTL